MLNKPSVAAAILLMTAVSGNAYTMLSTQSTTVGFEFEVQCADGRILHPKQISGRIHSSGGIYDTFDQAMAAAGCE